MNVIAKVSRPVVEGGISRHHLFQKLDQCFSRPIVWLTGPAGSGKTTLVSSYLDVRNIGCLWYRVDAGDEDPASVFYYLDLAADAYSSQKGEILPFLTPEYLLGLPVFSKRYFENLLTRFKSPFAIVFDNCQEVAESARFQDILASGLSNVPIGVNIVLISRNLPPPAFAGLRSKRRVSMMGRKDLCLTPEETKALLEHHAPMSFTDEAIGQIYGQTQGWAAGLVLMAERLAWEGVTDHKLDDLPHEEIFDYFAGEIFDKIDRQSRHFLLQTAILPWMTEEIAHQLTDNGEAGELLSRLNRNNFFTEKHSFAPAIYFYHPLFQAYLLNRMKIEWDVDTRRGIQKKAAVILEAKGHIEDAIDLYLTAGDVDTVARLVDRQAEAFINQGRQVTLLRWLRELPADIIAATPSLLYWRGVCNLPFDQPLARADFVKAFQLSRNLGLPIWTYLSWSGIIDSYYYQWDDFQPLGQWISQFDEFYDADLDLPAFIDGRVAASMAVALLFNQPFNPQMLYWVERSVSLAREQSDANLFIHVCCFAAYYYGWTGQADKLMVMAGEVRKFIDSEEISPLAGISWSIIEIVIEIWLHGAYDRALDKISTFMLRSHEKGLHVWDHMFSGLGVWASLAKRDLGRADYFLQAMRKVLGPGRRHIYSLFHYLEAWKYFLTGELGRALANAEIALRHAMETGYIFPQILCLLENARFLHAVGETKKGTACLEEAHELSRRSKSHVFDLACVLLRAQLALAAGEEVDGIAWLREGLLKARQRGYVDHIWWADRTGLADLCAKALEEEIESDFVRRVIRARCLLPSPLVAMDSWPWAIRISTLGGFEIHIDEHPLQSRGKVQRKPLSLLKATLAFGAMNVSQQKFFDALWPDLDGDRARRSFDMALHRLRKLLRYDAAVHLHDGCLSLDKRFFGVDAWEFEQLVDKSLRAVKARSGMATVEGLMAQVFKVYNGPFLEEEDEPWCFTMRERLQSRWLLAVESFADYWEAKADWRQAIHCYRAGLAADPLQEGFYQRLMLAHHAIGQRGEALAVYDRCRETLTKLLNVHPSPLTEAIRQQVLT